MLTQSALAALVGYSTRPKVSEFNYTFDHLADVMEGFVDTLGLTK